jgi:type II secretory pathway pseudopilin PulG
VKTDHKVLAQRPSALSARARLRVSGLTIVESMISVAVLATFAISATLCLMGFNKWAANDRNATAAMIIVQDHIDQALAAIYTVNQVPPILQPTAAGTDIDGDGVTDGVLDSTQPVVVTRDSLQTAIVPASLYRNVTAVGTTYGLDNDTDLLRVSFLLRYVYRSKTYYARAVTLKARE